MHETFDRDPAIQIRPSVGIIGGGQLARMTILAGHSLGCDFRVLERNPHSPARPLASHWLVGDWDNPADLLKLAENTDVVTFENEFVSADALGVLEARGCKLFPSAATLRIVQDKLRQKQVLAKAGIPVPRFEAVQSPADVFTAAAVLGWPLVLKKRRNGYDGKGNATVRSAAEVPEAWKSLGGGEDRLMVEEFCSFTQELAMIITRAQDGSVAAYPLVESRQENHICKWVLAPADVTLPVATSATALAQAAVQTVNAIGSFGIEMFLLPDGRVLLNELAPRVHNSGHYSIEACECSQFENHVRAVLGWPLGSTALRAPAAAMINLLGDALHPGGARGMEQALAVPGAHVHLYGKLMSGPLRKMGHVTALGATRAQALATAQRAASAIQFR